MVKVLDMLSISPCMYNQGNISSRFSCNSEVFASESQENL